MRENHNIMFDTLTPDGNLVNVRLIKQSDIQRCPHYIMVPTHYRDDGTCRCNDKEHTEMREWGYRWRRGQWR